MKSHLKGSVFLHGNEDQRAPCEMKVTLNEEGISQYKKKDSQNPQTVNTMDASQNTSINEHLFTRIKARTFKIDSEQYNFKMLICITMYKENMQDLDKTLEGIRLNLSEFKSNGIPTESVGVVIIFDGLEHTDLSVIQDENLITNQKTRNKLARYKKQLQNKEIFFDKELLQKGAFLYISRRNMIDIEAKDEIERYIFKYRFERKPEEALKKLTKSGKGDYMILMLCFKFYNGQKLDSHKWFLEGFCKTFPPEYITLVDCGAKPEKDAIYKLFDALETDKQVAGVCGYMSLYKQSILNENSQRRDEQWYDTLDTLSKLCDKFFSVQEAQIFEYSFAHIFDKPFESFFGFIQVLPGAFSAYRWKALWECKGDTSDGQYNLLKKYLPDEKLRMESIETANQYLAEDRILCLELFMKAGHNYILKYIPDAIVRVDPTTHLVDLLNQRRRWINGSWYAMTKVLSEAFRNSKKRKETKHSCVRLFGFYFLMVYNIIMQLISYFILGLYFVYLEIITSEYFSGYQILNFTGQLTNVSDVIMFIYVCLVGSLIFYSIYYKVREKPEKFYRASNFLGVFMLISFGYGIYVIIDYLVREDYKEIFNVTLLFRMEGEEFDRKVLRLLIYLNLIGYIIPCIFKLNVVFSDILVSIKDYAFFAPTYIHNLVIYAFCNVDDLSWGTKGLESSNAAEKTLQFKEYKIKKVIQWIFSNILLSYILVAVNSNKNYRVNFLLWTNYIYTTLFITKAIFAVLYHTKYYFLNNICELFCCLCRRGSRSQENKNLTELQSVYRRDLFTIGSVSFPNTIREGSRVNENAIAIEMKENAFNKSQKLNQIEEEKKEEEDDEAHPRQAPSSDKKLLAQPE